MDDKDLHFFDYLDQVGFKKSFSLWNKLSDQKDDMTIKFLSKQLEGIFDYKLGNFKKAEEQFNECLNYIENESFHNHKAVIFQNLTKQ